MSKKQPDRHYHHLDPVHTDPKRIKKERDKARELKSTSWWKQKIQAGKCHYCAKTFKPALLTMDHIIPIARGGESVKNNIVPACKTCNTDKKLDSPLDDLFAQIASENKKNGNDDHE